MKKTKFYYFFVFVALSSTLTLWIYTNNQKLIANNMKLRKVSHKHKKKSQPIKFLDTDDIYSRVLYNRVGKCGSRSLENIISILSEKNGFQFYQSTASNQTHLSLFALKEEVKLLHAIEPPMLYSRHIHFINFEKFGLVQPLYINMIRDPIERFSSQYHFRRHGDARTPGVRALNLKNSSKDLDINDCVLSNHTECSASKLWYIVPYFCGQDALCRRPSTEAVMRAKRHLLDNYLVVGFVEEFEETLILLEKVLPIYFKGAALVWKSIANDVKDETVTVKKTMLQPEVRKILRDRMALDYDFYRFALGVFKNLKAQVGLK